MRTLGYSIVIPAFNEAARLPVTLPVMLDASRSFDRPVEIIIVDDGSTDGTREYLLGQAALHDSLRIIRSEVNRGKGAAVRDGILQSQGNFIIVMDADLATPMDEIPLLIAPLARGHDLSFGVRIAREKVRRTWLRNISGRIFRLMVRLSVLPHAVDTQCGFKAFSRAAALKLFTESLEQGFLYDVEIYLLARRDSMKIAEVPVSFRDIAGTRMKVLDFFAMSWGLMRLRNKYGRQYK